MFGTNVVRKPENNKELQVAEVFYSIQGEGPLAGHPALFMRLTGCNLRCWFCDTKWDDEGDAYHPVEHLLEIAEEYAGQCRLVVLTGGEPFRQNILGLVNGLLKLGYTVQIETSGTILPEFNKPVLAATNVLVVVSPKTARVNPDIEKKAVCYKYVIKAGETSPHDGLPIVSTQKAGRELDIARPPAGKMIFLSPCDEYNPEKNLENKQALVEICKKYGYIAGVQMHKELGNQR